MPTISDNAIVIRRWDFSETSQTVSLFTREHGLIRGLAKGAKRERGDFSGGLDLLTRGQIGAIIKPGRDLATLTHWTLAEVFPALRSSLEANRAGLYLADLARHVLIDHDPSSVGFDGLIDALRVIGSGAGDIPAIDRGLLWGQWVLLDAAGYRPTLDEPEGGDGESETLGFGARQGGVVLDSGGADRWRVRRRTVQVLRQMATTPGWIHAAWPGAVNAAERDGLRRANKLLAAYAREALGRELPTLLSMFPELGGV